MTTVTIAWLGALLLVGIGMYGLLTARRLIRIVVALQIMTKGVVVAMLAAGYATGQIQLGQTLAITVLVADTIVAVVALALAILVQRHFGTLDLDALAQLKG
jgi:NADH:ubiquinone oxidoreductase subunit K